MGLAQVSTEQHLGTAGEDTVGSRYTGSGLVGPVAVWREVYGEQSQGKEHPLGSGLGWAKSPGASPEMAVVVEGSTGSGLGEGS